MAVIAKKQFPDLSFAVSTDTLRPGMNYAIVEGGKIIATNSMVMACIDLSIWMDEEQVAKLEGKVFDIHLLKKLAKAWKEILFHKDHILFVDKHGFCELNYYSGKIETDGTIKKYNPITSEFTDVSSKFPNWRSITPVTDKRKIKLTEVPEGDEINFNLDLLNSAVKCLSTKKISVKVTGGKKKPYLITPIMVSEYSNPEFSEYVILMPIQAL